VESFPHLIFLLVPGKWRLLVQIGDEMLSLGVDINSLGAMQASEWEPVDRAYSSTTGKSSGHEQASA
jgi:hypothetical protein